MPSYGGSDGLEVVRGMLRTAAIPPTPGGLLRGRARRSTGMGAGLRVPGRRGAPLASDDDASRCAATSPSGRPRSSACRPHRPLRAASIHTGPAQASASMTRRPSTVADAATATRPSMTRRPGRPRGVATRRPPDRDHLWRSPPTPSPGAGVSPLCGGEGPRPRTCRCRRARRPGPRSPASRRGMSDADAGLICAFWAADLLVVAAVASLAPPPGHPLPCACRCTAGTCRSCASDGPLAVTPPSTPAGLPAHCRRAHAVLAARLRQRRSPSTRSPRSRCTCRTVGRCHGDVPSSSASGAVCRRAAAALRRRPCTSDESTGA